MHALARRRRFDEWRLLETVEAARGRTAQELVTALADTVCAFQEPSPPVDDITVVAIRRRCPLA